jgi:two-component system, NtrC family, response regulator GlrR
MDDPRVTEALRDEAVRAVVRACRLTVTAGPGAGRSHELAAERIVIGADPRADLVLDDPALSKFHCEVTIRDGVAVVRDLGSRNGTRIDRVAVIEAPLRDGALLQVGRSELRFDLGTRDVAIPLASRDHFGRLCGRAIPMRAAFAQLEAAAASTATVMLQGESGTGKDLAAEALHAESARRDGPFVVVDCGAIPAQLLEAELFGYEAGAFTGATATRLGAFEAAHGGTLLLDEIGELALDLQPKLLRAIDRREIQRLGSTQRIAVDVRVVAATNRNLRQEVNARRFRSDLYFRLAVLVVTLPPLRDRASDIPLLVERLLGDLGARETPIGEQLVTTLVPELLRHSWPGNVRELRNYVETCVVRGEHALPAATDDPLAIDVALPLRVVREQWSRALERRYLELLLSVHGGNVSAAARAAGVDRVHLHRLLSRNGLR